MFEADASGRLIAQRRVTSYLNKYNGKTLDVEIHPHLPPGTVVFWSDRSPYELSGVANILEVHTRMDYTQIDWPPRTRRYEYGLYADGGSSPPTFAVLSNLGSTNGTFGHSHRG